MKKILLFCMMLGLTACSAPTEGISVAERTQSGETVTSNNSSDTAFSPPDNSFVPETPEMGTDYSAMGEKKPFHTLDGVAVDIDFTQMSGTVAYSQVMMMMYQPEDYWNQSIRIHGIYYPMDTPEFGLVHLLLILDDTLCCQGFVEFYLPQGSVYPENGAQIGLLGNYIYVEDEDVPYSTIQVHEYEI